VMRTFLDEGAITFSGEFFSHTGLYTFARPTQKHLPLKLGAMRGPKSFQVAAEFSDGCHHALGYTREAYQYMYDNMAIGAGRVGKNVDDLDIGAWMVFAVGEDSTIAKRAAASMVGIYASSMPAELLERNGVSPDDLAPILTALGAGDLPGAIAATTPEIADKLSIAGTPNEVTVKLKEIAAVGVNHMILAITDAELVKAFTGQQIDGVADVNTQLQLIHDKVMPEFA
jgi:5,10-methylenetetrahydromethanopterin reductase